MYLLQCLQDGTWNWIEWNDAFECVSSQHYTDFTQVPIPAREARLAIVIPGSHVLATQVKLPKMRAQEFSLAAPFALEEKLASDPESISVTAIGEPRDGHTPVVAIDKNYFESLWQSWRDHDFFPNAVLPDFLAIQLEKNTWTIVLQDQMAIVRIDHYFGFSVEATALEMCLNAALEDKPVPQKIICYQRESLVSLTSLEKKNIVIEYHDIGKNNFFDGPHIFSKNPINILQGKFRGKTQPTTLRNHWRIAGVAAAIWIGFLFVSQAAELFYFKHQTATLEKSVLLTYQKLFPNAKNVLEPHFRIKKLLKRFQMAEKDSDFFRLLNGVGTSALRYPDITLQSIQYENQSLQITATTKNLSPLTTWVNALRQQFSVRESQLRNDKGASEVQLIITETDKKSVS